MYLKTNAKCSADQDKPSGAIRWQWQRDWNLAGVQGPRLNLFLCSVTQLGTYSGTPHAWKSSGSVMLRICLFPVGSSFWEVSLPLTPSTKSKVLSWVTGAAWLPPPLTPLRVPHLPPAHRPPCFYLNTSNLLPLRAFHWLLFLPRALYFPAATWLLHSRLRSPLERGLF